MTANNAPKNRVRSKPFSIMQIWVVVAPNGVYYAGLHDNEQSAWTIALGWPSEDEISQAKSNGWYATSVTATWSKPTDNTLVTNA